MGLENPTHIAVLVIVLLLVFGAKRIPDIAKSLGTGMREFKDSISGNGSKEPEALTPPASPPPPPAPPPPPPPAQQAPPAAAAEPPAVPASAPAPAPDAR